MPLAWEVVLVQGKLHAARVWEAVEHVGCSLYARGSLAEHFPEQHSLAKYEEERLVFGVPYFSSMVLHSYPGGPSPGHSMPLSHPGRKKCGWTILTKSRPVPCPKQGTDSRATSEPMALM